MISDEVSELNQQSLQKREKYSLDTLVNGTSEEKSESGANFPAKPVDLLTPYESPSEDLRKAASQWAYCGGWCSCACHRRGRFKVPSVLGLLLLSFSGRGIFQPLCTESSCRGAQVTLLTLTYFFSFVAIRTRSLRCSSCNNARRAKIYAEATENNPFRFSHIYHVDSWRPGRYQGPFQ